MKPNSSAQKLRAVLAKPGLLIMPCCFDALSAKMIAQAGFPFTFMSGFTVSATRLGEPDTGLISYGEMLDQGRNICAAVDIPVIGDGDTGYGNPLNVRRTVQGYAAAGFAAIMIEDQLAPKRCGHTRGKSVVDRETSYRRIRAAVEAREEGQDILILARTDARHEHGIDEAIKRAEKFAELGANILFVEAPQEESELWKICESLPGPKMVNLIEGGITPLLSHELLAEIGFSIAAYPLTLLSTAMHSMQSALKSLKNGGQPDQLMDFAELRQIVGFDDYDELQKRYQ